jgi:hypothetical protein
MPDTRIHLIDDGSLDTVLACQDCGEEARFNFGPGDHTCIDGSNECDCYADFLDWCWEDFHGEHECEAQQPPRKLTAYERHQLAADHGVDTWEEWKGEK